MTSGHRPFGQLLKPGGSTDGLPPEARGFLAKMLRITTADANGEFRFENLPAGKYHLQTTITWAVPGRYGLQSSGGVVSEKVTILEGQEHRVLLTR